MVITYLWFISSAAFTSLIQQHYESMLLITILMMYFVISQVVSSFKQLQIYRNSGQSTPAS
ncbi:hypothetical protein [Paenibacillus wynnii]|uniref:hypothetical protein n=1 Tax=Paenibacillus wynnii TaxID=268407 RepID=UPI00278D6831|nr:hypothetical protein [Paenibacillus wynnii]MDQ0196443.1 hypothetical protein [Paenibacillus wynnii]